MKTVAFIICALAIAIMTPSAEQAPPAAKPRILVHLTSGPENPTKATLAFLMARTAVEQGHSVSMFLAGDADHRRRRSPSIMATVLLQPDLPWGRHSRNGLPFRWERRHVVREFNSSG